MPDPIKPDADKLAHETTRPVTQDGEQQGDQEQAADEVAEKAGDFA